MSSSINYYQTAAGTLQVTWVDNHITQAVFVEAAHATEQCLQLPEQRYNFLLQGTAFQKHVWQAACAIPAGSTMTYQQLANALGKPNAARAVGNALGSNKIAYFIPCHRVVQKNGSLGGYKWGLSKKRALLQAENSL